MECYSAIKNNEMMPFAAIWMDLEITIVSQKDKLPYDITYMWNLKYDMYRLTYKTDSQEDRRWLTSRRDGGVGIEWRLELADAS